MTDQEILQEISNNLQEIRKWSKVQGLLSMKDIVQGFDDNELVMFDAADGDTSNADIADAANVSMGMVSGRMQEWSNLGIVEKDGRQWKHLAPLKAMGIDTPDLSADD